MFVDFVIKLGVEKLFIFFIENFVVFLKILECSLVLNFDESLVKIKFIIIVDNKLLNVSFNIFNFFNIIFISIVFLFSVIFEILSMYCGSFNFK